MEVVPPIIEFTNKLYEQIVEKSHHKWENVFFSPVNIYTSLGMILFGSKCNTKTEMLTTMQLPVCLKYDTCHSEIYKLLYGFLKSAHGVEIFLANKLFAREGLDVKPNYKSNLEIYYNAQAENVTFNEDTLDQINKWVSEKTKGQIQQLLSPDFLTEDISAVVIAITYFKGTWKTAFSEYYSNDSEFIMLDGSKSKVKLMHIESSFEMVELQQLNSRAVKIPFKDPKFSMLIVLPNKHDGLPNLLKLLYKTHGISSILSSDFKKTEMYLYLPKFKLKEGNALNLRSYLQEMGMKDAFCQGSADFTDICDSHNLCISNILHKAVLEVDEKGAEAAAATATKIIPLSLCIDDEPLIEFRINHSFIIAIIWNNCLPLYLGHVINPTDN
ncbi:Leukocyte elastase inhibitor isoform 1 [Schistosoma japonicum]|uniref:Leukocyte elastase inhibitor isoform 1 n=1 Tax=Schistosoma japonicum TaxID=6182 RepID=A0A4Z2DKV0_SCHJA|nr:Leukocyte elastase inhibitor isoform 1 [Schistosoma japonicum]